MSTRFHCPECDDIGKVRAGIGDDGDSVDCDFCQRCALCDEQMVKANPEVFKNPDGDTSKTDWYFCSFWCVEQYVKGVHSPLSRAHLVSRLIAYQIDDAPGDGSDADIDVWLNRVASLASDTTIAAACHAGDMKRLRAARAKEPDPDA